MTELTHHDIDEGFHEIQLSGKQLVFLFMATTIVAVVIFLCGVQVGRGVRTERAVETSDAGAAIITPPVAATPSSTTAAGTPAAEPPAPAQEAEDDLSYAKRLQSDAAPQEQLNPRTDPAPAPATRALAISTPPPAARPTPRVDGAQGRPFDAPQGRPSGGAYATSPAVSAPAVSRAGAWVIQVHALKDRASAAAIARRLTGKGYPAFVLDPSAGAPPIYRVQVGRYNDRREAEQIAHRLEKEEQFKPWVQH